MGVEGLEPTAQTAGHNAHNVPPDQTAASSSLVADGEPLEETTSTDQSVDSSPQVEESEPHLARRHSAVEGIATRGVEVEEGTQTLPTAASNPPVEIIKPRSQASRQPLTQAALAKRPGVNSSHVSRMQSQPNFSKSSSERDPDGIAWNFNSKSKRFYPQLRE
jgi:hypothetical protein